MPSRREFDVPAAAIAATIGVVILLVSTPFTVQAYQKVSRVDQEFAVGWTEAPAGQKSATPAAPSTTLAVTDVLLARVAVEVKSCTDSRGPNNAHPAAVVHAKLTRTTDGKVLFDRDVPCMPGEVYSNRTAHPDIGSVQAADAEAARAELNATVAPARVSQEYRLEVTFTRGSPLPVQLPAQPPAGQPALSYDIQVQVGQWAAALAPPQEAGK